MLERLRHTVLRWRQRRLFIAMRLRFYQDYLDSGLLLRQYAQERAAQLHRRGHPAFGVVRDIAVALQAGVPVAAALRPVAPAGDIALVAAYEQDNRLDAGLAQVIRIVQEQERLGREVRGLLVRPGLYLAAGLAMLAFGVPLMVETLGPLLDPATLTLDQRWLIALGAWMQAWAAWVAGALAALGLGVALSLPRWSGPARRFLDRHSPVHRMYRAYQGAAFLQVLAVQLSVTPQLDRALAAIARHASPWLRSYLVEILRRLPHCRVRPMQAIDVGLLDAEVIDSLDLVAARGTAEAAIALRAGQGTDTAVRAIRRSATVLQQAGILLAGGLLAWMAASLVLSMVKTNITRVQQVQAMPSR